MRQNLGKYHDNSKYDYRTQAGQLPHSHFAQNPSEATTNSLNVKGLPGGTQWRPLQPFSRTMKLSVYNLSVTVGVLPQRRLLPQIQSSRSYSRFCLPHATEPVPSWQLTHSRERYLRPPPVWVVCLHVKPRSQHHLRLCWQHDLTVTAMAVWSHRSFCCQPWWYLLMEDHDSSGPTGASPICQCVVPDLSLI